MDEEQRKYFNSFVDAYNEYQAPNLAARAPEFMGYGYEAPTTNMVMAPQQMPQIQMDPNAIYDPTVGAAMQIMNRPMMIGQTPGLLGAGTDYQTQFGLLPNIASQRTQSYQRMADPTPVGLMDYVGGGGGDYGNYDPFADLYTYNEQYDAQGGGSRAPSWVSLPADMTSMGGYNNVSTDFMGYDPSQGGPDGVGGW
jgi:hypothetical protein